MADGSSALLRCWARRSARLSGSGSWTSHGSSSSSTVGAAAGWPGVVGDGRCLPAALVPSCRPTALVGFSTRAGVTGAADSRCQGQVDHERDEHHFEQDPEPGGRDEPDQDSVGEQGVADRTGQRRGCGEGLQELPGRTCRGRRAGRGPGRRLRLRRWCAGGEAPSPKRRGAGQRPGRRCALRRFAGRAGGRTCAWWVVQGPRKAGPGRSW